MNRYIYILYFLLISTAVIGCREEEVIIPAEYDVLYDICAEDSKVRGFYLVNEGNMGSNKCTLDFYDYETGFYARNFYAERNPNVVKELGDVGNDAGIYGAMLYVVVNCSHKVEVLDAQSGVRLAQVDIPNCRYVRFHGGKAYVSSYVGPVSIDYNAPKGAVYEVDTASLAIKRSVTVGYQPEEMEFIDGYMYVANSGGYRAPDYDNTLSVVRMSDFKQVRQIPVGINLHHVKKDAYNRLWVNSKGDEKLRPSRLYVVENSEVTDTLNIACSNMAIRGDSLYFYANDWSDITQKNTIAYGIIDVRTKQLVSDNFITDGTERQIKMPYGIALHPETGDIFVTDAKNYVSSGTLYCFTPEGKKKWSIRTGDIPAHITFLPK